MPVPAAAVAVRDPLRLRLLAAYRQTIGRDWDVAEVCSSFWRWYLNDRPGAWVELASGGRYRLDPGRVHLIPAWVGFSCHCSGEVGHTYFHFEAAGVPSGLTRSLFPAPFAAPLDADGLRAAQRLEGLLAQRALDPAVLAGETLAVLHRTMASVLAALPAADLARIAGPAAGANRVAPALQFVEDHLGESLPVGRLAVECGLGADLFARRFVAETGQSPAQYVLERRLAVAAERLLYGGDGIEGIASACGFPNRSYFSRMFARRFGLGPASFRRRGLV